MVSVGWFSSLRTPRLAAESTGPVKTSFLQREASGLTPARQGPFEGGASGFQGSATGSGERPT